MNIISPLTSHIPLLRSLWKEAFGDTDEFLDHFFERGFSPDRCFCAIVDSTVAGDSVGMSTDDTVAAALYWFHCEYMEKPVAYIYAVATAKEYRGQGICHELMAHTHAHLESLGYEGAVLVPGEPELSQFYRSMGYEFHCTRNEFTVRAVPEALPPRSFKSISKEKYALLRQNFLPPNGVIQENENLDFLATQLSFYAGKDFIMAGRIEKDASGSPVFHCPEILGDLAPAPLAIYKLGCERGDFCTPYIPISDEEIQFFQYWDEEDWDEEPQDGIFALDPQDIEEFFPYIPFAMYKPLGGSTLVPPEYFGFAFD